MKIKCGNWGDFHEFELREGLILKSIKTTTKGIEARIELTCPECGHVNEYMTLRSDFLLVSKEGKDNVRM